MPITAHVYQLYVAATPEQVWTAITDSAWTSRYLYGASFAEPPAPGSRYVMVTGGERLPAVDGVIQEMQPPVDGHPGRFVQTWHVLYDAALAEEPPGRVEWTIEAAGGCISSTTPSTAGWSPAVSMRYWRPRSGGSANDAPYR